MPIRVGTSSGGGNAAGVIEPVENIAALKGLDTTDTAVYKDKYMIIVESEKEPFIFDRDSSAAEDLPDIVEPSVGSGRWIRTGLVKSERQKITNLPENTSQEISTISSSVSTLQSSDTIILNSVGSGRDVIILNSIS